MIDGRWHYVHRLTCEAWHGPRRRRGEVAHSCGNRLCWAGEHVRWASHSENEHDKREHGRDNRGERHGMSKLTTVAVLDIRTRRARGETLASIAAVHGVQVPAIDKIVRRERWAWLD